MKFTHWSSLHESLNPSLLLQFTCIPFSVAKPLFTHGGLPFPWIHSSSSLQLLLINQYQLLDVVTNVHYVHWIFIQSLYLALHLQSPNIHIDFNLDCKLPQKKKLCLIISCAHYCIQLYKYKNIWFKSMGQNCSHGICYKSKISTSTNNHFYRLGHYWPPFSLLFPFRFLRKLVYTAWLSLPNWFHL